MSSARHAIAALSVAVAAIPSRADDGAEFFEKRIRPLLAEHCHECHGVKKQKGGLRLDSREALMRGGDSGTAITPGDADASLLIKAVRRVDKDLAMPPDKDGRKPLAPAAVADLAAWVKIGAPFPSAAGLADASRHWAFQPLKVTGNAKSVDDFSGTENATAADPRTLIRRMTYDLTGLPPTPEEADAFERDTISNRQSAISKLTERLLASPAYGEKWGRKWLDVVRYADTAGDNSDYPAPLAWRYRNYVIEAFNRDKPYDQFLREQLAGDILARDDTARFAELTIATGYLAIARRFGGSKDDRDFYLAIEDTIDTLGKSILGLTVACARCHNHKYDPISVRDYYGLYGILASTRFSFPGNEEVKRPRDLVPLASSAALKPWEVELARLDGEVKRAESALKEKTKAFAASAPVVLAKGDLPNGGSQDISPVENLTLDAGEMLQLAILPKTNHGADSTQIELEITDGAGRTWSLADVLRDFTKEGSGTHWGAWSSFGVEPATGLFTRLERDVLKTKGLHHWKGAADYPVVTANTADKPVKIINAVFASRSLVVHPAPAGGVAVAWASPGGTFRVKGRVVDIDPGGGDGVAWKLERRPGIASALSDSLTAANAVDAARRQREDHAAKKPAAEMAYAVAEREKPADVQIHKRGEPRDPGEIVPRKNLDLLGGQSVESGSGRLALAHWLTDPKNPLTARVMVNRIWLGHFGRGLVATPNDFGTRGTAPENPELLDWLASKFIESGWSVKAMHRLILSSAAYRSVAADVNPQAARNGRSARAFTSAATRRLDAEEIRDTLLTLSGELDRTPGTGHPFPAESTWAFTQHNPFKALYDSNKRSVYLMTQRIQRHPMLALFDGADTNLSTPARAASTVPTQALWFMNDPFVHACAAAFARRITAAPESERIPLAWRLCYHRPPTERETQNASAFLAAASAETKDASAAWTAYARVLFASNELLTVD